MLRAEREDDRTEAEDSPLERRTGRVGELMPKPWQQEAIITTMASDRRVTIFWLASITRSQFLLHKEMANEAGLITQKGAGLCRGFQATGQRGEVRS